MENDEVIEALKPYGEIKSEIFRLKYKRDHELAGIENGIRLVKMILEPQDRLHEDWRAMVSDYSQ